MNKRIAAISIWLCSALLISISPTMAAEVTLHIPPVFQERPSWCWTAVGEMVFKYYGISATHRTDYQCGIAQGKKLCAGMPDCTDCNLSAGDEAAMIDMLEQYPLIAASGGTAGEIALTVQLKIGNLSEEEVKRELDEGRPIIVGLSPRMFKVDGLRQHMALIVGYDTSSGNLVLTVNDPFPFEDMRYLWMTSPYFTAGALEDGEGRYEIGYDKFRSRLKWTQTMYRMTCTGPGCPSDRPRAAEGAAAKDEREVTQTVLAATAGDFTSLRTGHKAVDAEAGTTWQSLVAFPGAKECLIRDKDDHHGARWSCLFRFADRSEADTAVVDLVQRLRNSLPQGWIGKDLDEDSETELYTKTDKFSASQPGNTTAISLYLIDIKKDGRVKVYLSVENQ